MIRSLFTLAGAAVLLGSAAPALAQGVPANAGLEFQKVYDFWRTAMIQKNLGNWQAITASHRQTLIKNRVLSERRGLAQSLFNVPTAPPDVKKLRLMDTKMKGPTAKTFYFGKVDFGVEGVAPTDNLLVLSFVQNGARKWKYDTADYVNLSALPDVRKQLAAGNITHLNRPEFAPTGIVPRPMVSLQRPVKYIAKTYVFCPGREVEVHVNKVSRHLFQNTKSAEIVIGGARDGRNEVQYTIKGLPGGQGNEPLTVRVYLLSEVPGVKPIEVFKYQVEEKGKVIGRGAGNFNVTPAVVKKLMGK